MRPPADVSPELGRALERCEIEEWEDIYHAATADPGAAWF